MTSAFSGGLRLTDLDDFIKPSQECVLPVKIEKNKTTTGAKIKISPDGTYIREQSGVEQKLKKVEITLADCLACSGCITSAESILITEQSQEELLKILSNNITLKKQDSANDAKLIVISLSVQPIVSLSIKYGLSVQTTFEKVAGYFKNLGADMVVNMRVADDISLLESSTEFIERYNSNQNLPMFASACPGWVCYAEKTHGFVLPNISTTKSPQQIMGVLVRDLGGDKAVYHVTLMSCYDKKLEASREDFHDDARNSRDVDCVITPIELEQMLQNDNLHLGDVESKQLDNPWSLDNSNKNSETCNVYSYEGSNSGGYSNFIFKQAAKQLFDIHDAQPVFMNLRNPDFKEAILEVNNEVVLRFAVTNGFKNIQNIMQKLKRKKLQYHFVEIMACPSGCLNGGAQNRPEEGTDFHEHISKLEQTYHNLTPSDPVTNVEVNEIYNKSMGGINSDKTKHEFHTTYKAIEKTNSGLHIKW